MNRIKELRVKNGYTQAELAKALNISQGSISGYETGRFEPDLDTIKKMSELFNVTMDELFVQETSLKAIGDAMLPQGLNQKLRRLTAGLMQMPGSELDRVDKILSAAYPEFFEEERKDDE